MFPLLKAVNQAQNANPVFRSTAPQAQNPPDIVSVEAHGTPNQRDQGRPLAADQMGHSDGELDRHSESMVWSSIGWKRVALNWRRRRRLAENSPSLEPGATTASDSPIRLRTFQIIKL